MEDNNVDIVINTIKHLSLNYLIQYINSDSSLQLVDVWKLLFAQKYPRKPFFNSWSSKQNYLVQHFNKFSISICFGDSDYLCSTLFEYDPMLRTIISMFIDFVKYESPELLELTIENRFVVIHQNTEDYISKIIGQCSSENECRNCIVNHFNENKNEEESMNYAIVNLEKMTPMFWRQNIVELEMDIISNDDDGMVVFIHFDYNDGSWSKTLLS